MKTLHLYLTRQVLATLLMTVAVFTFVLLLGNVLKEILELLISGQASLANVVRAFGLLVPWVLVFALPMGMLTAALLVFGRFSADQELTAARAGGVSLVALITPILLLSLALCGLSAWINMDVAPRCRFAYVRLRDELGAKLGAAVLPEGRYVPIRDENSKTSYTFYAGTVNDSSDLQDIIVWCVNDQTGEMTFCQAPRGAIVTTNGQSALHLYDVWDAKRLPNGEVTAGTWPEISFELGNLSAQKASEKPSITDMTYSQLDAELRNLEGRFSTPISGDVTIDALAKLKDELDAKQADLTMPLRVQMHRQIAISFACFGFTLVGIPLGIRAHRRETNVGFALALVLVLVYYSFIIIAQSLQTHADWAPYLMMWIPNFIFQAAGAVMLWRANRGI
jgi:lipopolysaccharide export system permease protein